MTFDRHTAAATAEQLTEPVTEARNLARKLGLDPVPVNYWIVDYDEMNELIAYEGFQTRYPHWRWGMQYDKQRKQDQYLGGKAFEIVNNDSPAHAFLQESNTLPDQKAVITHVEAHADFFNTNEWFGLFPDRGHGAARMLERHAERIQTFMSDPDIDREAVERWIDHVLAIADTIDQHQAFETTVTQPETGDQPAELDLEAKLEELDIDEQIKAAVFDLPDAASTDDPIPRGTTPRADVLAFLRDHGKQYDPAANKAVPYEDWQREVIELLRTEAYYFAPQRLTKVQNEGWASYFESLMMTGEGFAEADEFLTYADHMAAVLGSGGLNPYKLGRELWEYIENRTNRREVIEQLLRVEGITWRNFHDAVSLDRVRELLAPPPALQEIDLATIDTLPDQYLDTAAIDRARAGEIDVDRYPWKLLTYDGLAHRHYSLLKPQHRHVLDAVDQNELERISRYLFETDRYDSVEAAIDAVSYTAGWDRMHEVRRTHNDVTFLDAFLTDEFITNSGYFTYEYSQATGAHHVASTDPEAIKQKLLVEFTNFGKPTIVVEDGNYNNRNELLLAHQYNGIGLDIEQAQAVLKRTFELWGRPVNLKTIEKRIDERDLETARRQDREPTPEEAGLLLRYDGDTVSESDLPWGDVEHLVSDVNYDTTPEEWL